MGAERPRRSTWRAGLGIAVGLAIALSSVLWSSRFLRADAEVLRGVAAFEEERFALGERLFRNALRLRFDPHYNGLLMNSLGAAVLSRPSTGDLYISKMKGESTYLEDFPNISSLSVYARWMHQWSVYKEDVEAEALTALRDVQRLDPYNPVLVISTAEALLHSGRPEAAARMAAGLRDAIDHEFPEYRQRYPEIPAIVAIAAHAAGNHVAAQSALEAAIRWSPRDRASNCHVIIATELVQGQRTRSFAAIRDDFSSLSLCPSATLALLPQFEPNPSQQ